MNITLLSSDVLSALPDTGQILHPRNLLHASLILVEVDVVVTMGRLEPRLFFMTRDGTSKGGILTAVLSRCFAECFSSDSSTPASAVLHMSFSLLSHKAFTQLKTVSRLYDLIPSRPRISPSIGAFKSAIYRLPVHFTSKSSGINCAGLCDVQSTAMS